MVVHQFILEQGIWYGEGTIKISSTNTIHKFYTKWNIEPMLEGVVRAIQEVEIVDVKDKNRNLFHFSHLEKEQFLIQLENEIFGKVEGRGLIEPNRIAWEFHGDQQIFEGFELYEKINQDQYSMRAEFMIAGEPHTIISSKIWKKTVC